MPAKKTKTIKKRIVIPKRQLGFRACRPSKHVFDLFMFKKMAHKNMIIIFKHTPVAKYLNIESKEHIKFIKDAIMVEKYKLPPIIVVTISGVFNVINPEHIKILMAIKSISYKHIKCNKKIINVSVLSYLYISKEETLSMIKS